MCRQPIPVVGISFDLEVVMEKCYNEYIMDTATQEKKALQEKSGTKPSLSSKPSGLKNMGCRETIKIHLKKMTLGQDWTHIPPKDKGPDIGKCYEPPRHQDGMGASQAGGSQTGASQASRSPLTDELLAPGDDVTTVLDCQYDVQEDLEIAQAIAHIPPRSDAMDVEMEDVNVPPESNLRSATLVTTSTLYDIQTILHQAQFPWLQHRRTRCWMRSQHK